MGPGGAARWERRAPTGRTDVRGGVDRGGASRGLGIVRCAGVREGGFEHRVQTIDMGQGEAAYKMGFATGSREATTLWIVRARHPARVALSTAMLARRAIKALPTERVDAVRGRAAALRARAEALLRAIRRGPRPPGRRPAE